jgi:histidyl-tRNA synthetase
MATTDSPPRVALKALRGMQDILPADEPHWQAMHAAAARVVHLFGYRLIETPILEMVEVFQRGVGQDTDVVAKEMYLFEDRGGRQVALRPEGTAPVVRAYFEGGLDQGPQPARLYYIGPMFRYDRPQAGRYRQLHQFGVEAIGEAAPGIDVEVIEMGWQWYEALGLKGVSLQINSLGDAACRPRYREALRQYYRPHLPTMCAECRERFESNPLRLLDCKKESCEPLKAAAPSSLDFLCEPCTDAFSAVQAGLKAAKIPFAVNQQLVRGLDYYTRTVFEFWHSSLSGAQNALGAGGRYDGLAEAMGFKAVPGMGFALGMDRTLMVLKEQGDRPAATATVQILPEDATQQRAATQLARALRGSGIATQVDYSGRSLKAKMRQAGRSGARIVCIIGAQEERDSTVVVRDMERSAEEKVARQEALGTITRLLGQPAREG